MGGVCFVASVFVVAECTQEYHRCHLTVCLAIRDIVHNHETVICEKKMLMPQENPKKLTKRTRPIDPFRTDSTAVPFWGQTS